MKRAIPAFVAALLLVSCSASAPTPSLEDYQTDVNLFAVQDEVRILQMTDIHWSVGTDFDKEEKYLRALVAKADPDIVMVTGDSVLTGARRDWTELRETLDTLKNSRGRSVYWGLTYGNHDRQGDYKVEDVDSWIKEYSEASSYDVTKESRHHGLYKNPADEVQGRSNYVVNLKDGEGNTLWQLYALDTNSDYYHDGGYTYDVIRENQIDWFKKISASTRKEGGPLIPGLAFFHIPLYQTIYSYDAATGTKTLPEGDFGGALNESKANLPQLEDKVTNPDSLRVYVGYKDTGFFDVARENGIKGMFYGHDHANDFWAVYQDVLLAYGTKTGEGLSYRKGLIGGNLITVHKDGSFDQRRKEGGDFEQILLSEEDL